MRILLIHNYYQYWGGEDTYFESLKKLLEEKGHTVIAYTKDSKDIKTIFDKVKVGISLFWNRKAERELAEIIKRFKPEIAHFNNIYPLIGATAYRICKRFKIPIIQHIHNYRFMCPKGILFRNGKICELCVGKNLPFYSILYGCYHQSRLASFFFSLSFFFHKILGTFDLIDKFIFPSEFTKDYYFKNLQIEGSKGIVIPHFVDMKQRKTTKTKKKDYFLFVGRLSEEKGIIQLLEVFKTLPKINLRVIGDGPLRDKVLGYKRYKNIQIVGFVPHDKIRNFLRETICIIIPSLWYEVMPFIYIEAMITDSSILIPSNLKFKNTTRNNMKKFDYNQGDFNDLREKIIKINRSKSDSNIYNQENKVKYFPQNHYNLLFETYIMLAKENY